jgi:F420H(2)-dependent quinone reductase
VPEEMQPKRRSPFEEWLIRTFTRYFAKANVWLYRKTDGRWGGKFQGKAPVVLVTMIGRKTGKERTTPVIHIPHGDGLLMVASQGGLAKNPAWYGNLVANPEITVQIKRARLEMTARQVSDDEKDAMWPSICKVHSEFEAYKSLTDRNIPVFECTPRGRKNE